MSQPAVAYNEYSLAYDPQRFNMKAIFAYEVNNHILVRKMKLTQRHNELTDDERQELSTLLTVEKYLQNYRILKFHNQVFVVLQALIKCLVQIEGF